MNSIEAKHALKSDLVKKGLGIGFREWWGETTFLECKRDGMPACSGIDVYQDEGPRASE